MSRQQTSIFTTLHPAFSHLFMVKRQWNTALIPGNHVNCHGKVYKYHKWQRGKRTNWKQDIKMIAQYLWFMGWMSYRDFSSQKENTSAFEEHTHAWKMTEWIWDIAFVIQRHIDTDPLIQWWKLVFSLKCDRWHISDLYSLALVICKSNTCLS